MQSLSSLSGAIFGLGLLIAAPVVSNAQMTQAVGADAGSIPWALQSGGFQLGAKMPTSTFHAGASMPVEIGTKNNSASTARLFRYWLTLTPGSLTVYDSAGLLVPERPHVHFGYSGNGTDGLYLFLPPGQVETESLDLNILYDLTAGTYTIRLDRHIFEKDALIGEPLASLTVVVV